MSTIRTVYDPVIATIDFDVDVEARRARLRAISDRGAPVLATPGLSHLLWILAAAIVALAIYLGSRLL